MKSMVLMLMIFFPNCLWATTCIKDGGIFALDKEFDYAFIGEVQRKEFDFSLFTEKFSVNVLSVSKGNISPVINVWTPNVSNCGADFRIGKKYVIFAKKYKGKIFTYYDSSWLMSKENQYLTNNYIKFYSVQ